MAQVIRRGVITLAALAVIAVSAVAPAGADPGNGDRFPELGDCQQLRVAPGHIVAFEAVGVGVQIYRWNGTSWVFVAPEAFLFHGDAVVAVHSAGPTWESASGSTVVGAVVDKCTPDPTAIPWLKLAAVTSDGPGIFDGVTFIQRLNTVGGLAPSEPGDFVGEIAKVPYAADYVFYRKPQP